MKEDKKTVRKPNASKKPNTANKKHTTQQKKNNNVNKNVSEAPRVTKIESTVKEKKNVAIENDFIEEDNDKKLIVVIAIAVLVILATIIGLLVGFDKEEETPEPPKDDEIVVPVEKDEDEKQDVVVKVTTTKSQKEDKEEEEVIVIPTYDVIYYYGQENRKHQDSVEEGNAIDEYVPTGYSSCTYHKDANFTEEYEFDNVYEDQTVYLQCTAITYTVVYNFDANKVTDNTANAITFDVDNPVDLVAPTTTSVFVGWYLENGTQVTTLDRKLVKYADENNTINLFAELTDKVKVEFYNNEDNVNSIDSVELTQASYTLPDVANMNVCPTSGKFLGWSTKENNKNVVYNNKAELQLTEDIKLYAVCGDATIVYVSNEETVTVGYTNAEINDLGIALPEPSQLGMETPTYFVPVDAATSTSKKVVSDDEVELGEDEVYFSQVVENAVEGYTPTVGDNVEGFDKVFLGWIEKTEETPSEPTTQEPTPGVETAANEENAVTEDTTIPSESEETPIVEEEVVEPFEALPEEIVEELTTSTEETPSVELEAVWGIPEVEETPVEPTPEEQVPEVASLPVA